RQKNDENISLPSPGPELGSSPPPFQPLAKRVRQRTMNARYSFEPGDSQNRVLVLGLLLSISLPSASGTRAETGVPAWVQRYSHLAGSSDYANTLVTDNAGNVVVAGSTYGGGITGSEMLVIKYSGAGVPLWTNRCNGNSAAAAVAVDSNGNVF